MLTLTKTLLDIADCNITQHYLGDAAADDPLAFSRAESYNALYARIAVRRTPYEDIRGVAGEALDQLRGTWSTNAFWTRYFGEGDKEFFPPLAWDQVVPIAGTLKERVEIVLPDGFDLQISPVPSVLLYPFGWSTWISFRIAGDHTLGQLAALIEHLTEGAAFRPSGEPAKPLTLMQYLNRVGRGVRNDAFGGKNVAVFNPQNTLAVTTVVGKHRGSLSLGALTQDQEAALKQIVRSAGATPAKDLAVALPRGASELVDFVLHDGLSWFLWAEHLLKPSERFASQLGCYHNNTFRSLQHVWLLQTLLERALRIKTWSAALSDLAARVTTLLGDPSYKNVSMLDFLGREEHVNARAAVEKRLAPPAR
jgi:hypothetical protein